MTAGDCKQDREADDGNKLTRYENPRKQPATRTVHIRLLSPTGFQHDWKTSFKKVHFYKFKLNAVQTFRVLIGYYYNCQRLLEFRSERKIHTSPHSPGYSLTVALTYIIQSILWFFLSCFIFEWVKNRLCVCLCVLTCTTAYEAVWAMWGW